MDFIHMAQDNDEFLTLVNKVVHPELSSKAAMHSERDVMC